MNGLGKQLDKKPIQKAKNCKNQSDIAACEQEKTTKRKSEVFFKHRSLILF